MQQSLKTQPPNLPGKKRWHDLDALRAFAMLLGIGLHGFMSFVALPLPVWPAQDIHQHDSYLFALHAIHGFRLQLFFLVSGFFTMMLFRQRGLRGLVKHRAKRIL
ncbi:MAG: acyltransferase family protein, partial [Verrucomicrobiota bacterium]|nr:acyltransferase family protein [Verrucomicrobiota bacterium]